jgi:hypothetical protein
MKTKNRVQLNHINKTPLSQGKTIANPGQRHTTNGLDDGQITAFKILAKRYGKTPDEFLKGSINEVLQTFVDDLKTQLLKGSLEEKKAALSVLRSLPEPFQPSEVHIDLAAPAPGVIAKPLADQVKAALDELQSAGAEAIALLAMTTNALYEAMVNQPNKSGLTEWSEFSQLIPEGGIAGLAVSQVKRFKDAMTAWLTEQYSLINRVIYDGPESRLESEIYSLNSLLEYQALVYSVHYAGRDKATGALFLVWPTSERLFKAWSKSLALFSYLRNAASVQPLDRAA